MHEESEPAGPPLTPRVSIRTIAQLAGVSAMTVSKALRNVPKVSKKTRARIVRIAEKIGYRPDPEMAKLMYHLRRRTESSFQGLICGITDRPGTGNLAHPYVSGLIAGSKRRALNLGYAFDLIRFEEDSSHRRNLRRVIRARGAQGVLLLPLREPFDLSDLLPWSEFSAVAVTLTTLAPRLHRAIPDHFANTLTICRQLGALGYRRAGLVIDSGQELRVNHAFSAAVVRHNLDGRTVHAPPFIFDRLRPAELRAWYRRERPDAIIATDDTLCREYARLLELPIPGPVGFVSTNTTLAANIAGIDELPVEVGATAVNLLAGMILHGERGLPRHATTTEVHGLWLAGSSCPKRTASARTPGPKGLR